MLKQLLLGSVMTLATITGANALIIDDFTDLLSTGGAVISTGPAVFDRSFQVLGTILGGDRELVVDRISASGSVIAEIVPSVTVSDNGTPLDPTDDIFAGNGVFTHNNPTGSIGTSLLRWDGTAGDTNGLDFNLGGAGVGIDLTQGGLLQYIHISVLAADVLGSIVSLTLYSSVGNYSTALVNLPTGPSEHFFSLAAIAALNTSGTGVDLMDVRAIELYAQGAGSFDVAIDIIEVVPEPASLTLLGAGIMGLGAIKRRRQTA